MSEQEEWRPIVGFPDYRVSSLGRVVSVRSHRGSSEPRELRGSVNGVGYRKIDLRGTPGVSTWRYVHHLVAEAFIGPRPEGQHVCHFDGDSFNNAAVNLRYATPSENERDKVRHGTHRKNLTECKHGHPFDDENTYIIPSTGMRACWACIRTRRAQVRTRRLAMRAAARMESAA